MTRRASRRSRLGAAGLGAAAALALLVQPALMARVDRSVAQTAPAAGDPVIVAAGDIVCQPPNVPEPPESKTCQHFATAGLIDRINPTAVLALGDLQYNSATLTEFMGKGGYDETWGRYKAITRPTIGDNEYEVVHGTGYWDYWNGPGNTQGQAGTRNEGWYSYDIGAWHVIALNSEREGNGETWISHEAWEEQLAWLRADVAAHRSTCMLAYWHEPLFSTGTSYGEPKAFARILYEAGVDVVLSGHAHRYEHFLPQDPDGNATPSGFHSWTIGTGGKSINPVQSYDKNLATAGEGFGVLEMTLHPGSFDWQFVSAPGTTIDDSGSAPCNGTGSLPGGGPTVSSLNPASGPKGQSGATVEVVGSGFANGTTVDFGPGVTVRSVTVASPSRLVASVDITPGAGEGARNVTVTGPGGSATCTRCFTITPAGTAPPPPPPAGGPGGYWFTARDGGIFAFGDARFHGSTGAMKLAQPIVGMATTRSGTGYWLVAADGGIFAFGDAAFHGSTGAMKLAGPIVGMATTRSGKGYWMVASDGGIFAFGDAVFHGSTGAMKLARPIVGMTLTPTGNGYWLVASDGGIFAFGDARFHGSTGALELASPIVAMAATPSGRGYWLAAADGGLFNFGDAAFRGSLGQTKLARPIVGMSATPGGAGYWMVASDGGVFAFGDAVFEGSTGAIKLNQPIVGMAPLSVEG